MHLHRWIPVPPVKARTAAQWLRLTPAYRARLERRGITQGRYTAGEPLAVARGHAVTPEHPGRQVPFLARAIRNGLVSDLFIPPVVWAGMTPAERAKAAHDYQLAYFEKGQGTRLTKAERAKRGLLPQDRNVYRHRSHDQELADVEFQQLMVQIHGHHWDDDEWKAYRGYYYGTFAAAA